MFILQTLCYYMLLLTILMSVITQATQNFLWCMAIMYISPQTWHTSFVFLSFSLEQDEHLNHFVAFLSEFSTILARRCWNPHAIAAFLIVFILFYGFFNCLFISGSSISFERLIRKYLLALVSYLKEAVWCSVCMHCWRSYPQYHQTQLVAVSWHALQNIGKSSCQQYHPYFNTV